MLHPSVSLHAGLIGIHWPMMATGMSYRSRRIVMLKHVLITRNSSSIVPCGTLAGVWTIVMACGRDKSGTVDRARVGACAGVLLWVRAGCARVSDRGILSVQCVYM